MQGHHPLHKGTKLRAMRNDELHDRLHRILELMEEADREGWDALSRDLALDELRVVYTSIHGTKLVQRAPKQPVVIASPLATPLAEVNAELPMEPNVSAPEPAVTADRPEVSLHSTRDKEASSDLSEPKNEEAPAKIDVPAPITAPVTTAKPDSAPQPIYAESAPPRPDETEPRILGERLNKPIADLRTGIPLNEKFGLIKNLFGNNASEFQDAILHLNRCADAHTLMSHLEEMRIMGNWDAEDPYFLQLYGFVERKGTYLSIGQGG